MSYLMTDLTVTPGNTVYYIWLGFFLKESDITFYKFFGLSKYYFHIILLEHCKKHWQTEQPMDGTWVEPTKHASVRSRGNPLKTSRKENKTKVKISDSEIVLQLYLLSGQWNYFDQSSCLFLYQRIFFYI